MWPLIEAHEIPKGKTLDQPKEGLTREMRDDLSSTDGQNHTAGTEDPFPAVPTELKALHQWVLLKEELRNGKPTKIPYQVDGNRANANDPNTWTDFQTVCNHRDHLSDIGFVFSKDDPYCGIYIHNSINVTAWHGNISRWAVPLVSKVSPVAYQENSSSRNATKFWIRASLPNWMKKGKRKSIYQGEGEIEVYHYERYFTVTGKGMGEIKDGQAVVDSIVWQYFRQEQMRQKREKRRQERIKK